MLLGAALFLIQLLHLIPSRSLISNGPKRAGTATDHPAAAAARQGDSKARHKFESQAQVAPQVHDRYKIARGRKCLQSPRVPWVEVHCSGPAAPHVKANSQGYCFAVRSARQGGVAYGVERAQGAAGYPDDTRLHRQ